MYICQACCLAFPAWVTGRASVHNCSRDTMPWGPEQLVLLSSYTAPLQNYYSVPLVHKKSTDPTFLPFSPCQVPLSVAGGRQMYQVSYGSRKRALRSLASTRAGCSYVSLVLCHDRGVFSRCLPSLNSFFPTTPWLSICSSERQDSQGFPQTHFLKSEFHFQASSSAFSQTSTDCHAYLIWGHTHYPLFGNIMRKCFPWWLVIYQKAFYNSGFCHNIINPPWTWNVTWTGVGYRAISKY